MITGPGLDPVIPTQAGIHLTQPNMDPRFRGDDDVRLRGDDDVRFRGDESSHPPQPLREMVVNLASSQLLLEPAHVGPVVDG